jgi:hypothetical protein
MNPTNVDPHPALPFTPGMESFETSFPKQAFAGKDMKKVPRAIKIVLNSANRDSGSLTEAMFNIRLPINAEFNADRLIMVVESLVHATGPNNNTNIDVFPTHVAISEFRNPYSWESRTKGPHGIIAVTGSRNYQNSSQKDLGGATLVDRRLFDRPITITFTSPNYTTSAANGVSNDWTLVLSLWDAGA